MNKRSPPLISFASGGGRAQAALAHASSDSHQGPSWPSSGRGQRASSARGRRGRAPSRGGSGELRQVRRERAPACQTRESSGRGQRGRGPAGLGRASSGRARCGRDPAGPGADELRHGPTWGASAGGGGASFGRGQRSKLLQGTTFQALAGGIGVSSGGGALVGAAGDLRRGGGIFFLFNFVFKVGKWRRPLCDKKILI
jgi:hypothetical protein